MTSHFNFEPHPILARNRKEEDDEICLESEANDLRRMDNADFGFSLGYYLNAIFEFLHKTVGVTAN